MPEPEISSKVNIANDAPFKAGLPTDNTHSSNPLIGKVVAGKFEILSVIGAGGMSVVCKARHIALGKTVALKLLQAERLKDARDIDRFQREAQAATSLNHPNIVPVREFGLDDECHPYIVMDFIDGTPLPQLIKEGNLTAARALSIACGVCRGLDHAHQRGVVHRDIKPENILIAKDVDGSDLPMIVDFGVARFAVDDENRSRLTQTGEVFGTPTYMAPEQALGFPTDCRADIYALGTVVYEMLTGKPPFTAGNPLAMLMKHVSQQPEPMANVPAQIQSIVMRAMAKDPAARYKSAAELERVISTVSADSVLINLPMWTFAATLMLRAVAWLIDTLIISLPGLAIALLLSPTLSDAAARGAAFCGPLEQFIPCLGGVFVSESFPGSTAWVVFAFALIAINYLYDAFLESSVKRATFGKLWVGLATTNRSLQRMSFREASLRHWSKMIYFIPFTIANHVMLLIPLPENLYRVKTYLVLGLSSAIVAFIAFIMRKRYQMLHDYIAGSMVVPSDRRIQSAPPAEPSSK